MNIAFFLEVLFGGLLAGTMYALVAIGFVLIYKASGVFNFAQGAMVFFAALTFVSLVERGMNFWLALALTLAVMVVLGVATEKVVLRPLINQPQITLFMATIGLTFVLALLAIAAIGYAFIPTLVNQVNEFVQAVPGYADDLTKGKGRFGFLETKYHIVERIREQIDEGGASKVLGLTGAALSVTKSVISLVVATITIAFLTFFMLLEGPVWVDRFYGLLPEGSRERWRKVGYDIYRTVGGYVTGNLAISLIAGTLTTIVLLALDVPFAVSFARMAKRDGRDPNPEAESNRRYYEGQQLYLRECRPRDEADVVVDYADMDLPMIVRG